MAFVKDRIKVGEAELIFSDEQMPLTMDETFVPIKNPDGTWKFLTTDLGKKPYYHKFIGTPENPFEKHEYFGIDFNGHCEEWPSGLWVWSTYKCEDGMLIGFTHRELFSRTDPFFRNYWLIGISVSYDNGDSWKYLGDILSNVANGSHGEKGNMGGCSMLAKDGYFTVYFNEFRKVGSSYISAARMEIDETIAAVREGKLPKSVKKYTGSGVWDTDPIEESGARIVPDIGCHIDSHGKGAFCRTLDRFLLCLMTGGNGKLVMFISEDGEHFGEHIIIDETGVTDLMQPYATFVSTDGDCTDDMREIGREFYIYYPRKSTKNYSYDELYRRKITIE